MIRRNALPCEQCFACRITERYYAARDVSTGTQRVYSLGFVCLSEIYCLFMLQTEYDRAAGVSVAGGAVGKPARVRAGTAHPCYLK
eukprot:scaffold844_cov602-Prasinococcus_capsulatus_cf.AAC.1